MAGDPAAAAAIAVGDAGAAAADQNQQETEAKLKKSSKTKAVGRGPAAVGELEEAIVVDSVVFGWWFDNDLQ
jgi:hypothetical protein